MKIVFLLLLPRNPCRLHLWNVNKSADSEQSGPGKVSISQYCRNQSNTAGVKFRFEFESWKESSTKKGKAEKEKKIPTRSIVFDKITKTSTTPIPSASPHCSSRTPRDLDGGSLCRVLVVDVGVEDHDGDDVLHAGREGRHLCPGVGEPTRHRLLHLTF